VIVTGYIISIIGSNLNIAVDMPAYMHGLCAIKCRRVAWACVCWCGSCAQVSPRCMGV